MWGLHGTETAGVGGREEESFCKSLQTNKTFTWIAINWPAFWHRLHCLSKREMEAVRKM